MSDLPHACVVPDPSTWIAEAIILHRDEAAVMRYVMQASGGRLNPVQVTTLIREALRGR